MTKKIIVGVLILAAVGVGAWYWYSHRAPQLIGGDQDAHGCIGPAGYSWCDAKQKCLRVWEEACPTNP